MSRLSRLLSRVILGREGPHKRPQSFCVAISWSVRDAVLVCLPWFVRGAVLRRLPWSVCVAVVLCPPHAEDPKVLLLAMMHEVVMMVHEMVMSDGGGLEMMKVTATRRSHEGAHDGVVPARSRPQYRLNASSAPAPPPWVNVMMMMMRPQEMMHEWVVQVVVAGIMEGMAMMRVMITMIV